jgi:hypothetical protein
MAARDALLAADRAVRSGDLSAAADALLRAESGPRKQRDEARLLRDQLWAGLGYPSQLCPRGTADTLARRDTCPEPGLPTTAGGQLHAVKMVVVGDGGIGKTSLLHTATSGSFPENRPITDFHQYVATILIDGCPVSLSPWDTPGQPEYDRIRPLMYPDTQIFILTYAVDRRSSFENIRRVWMPELAFNHWPATRGTHHSWPGASPGCMGSLLPPIALVGLCTDRRDDAAAAHSSSRSSVFSRPADCVTMEEGVELARRIGACYFDECSAIGIRDDSPNVSGGAGNSAMEILQNCTRLALTATLEPRVPDAAAARGARKCADKHMDLLHSIGGLPTGWCHGPNMRIIACRQRLAFAGAFHARLTCDDSAVAALPLDVATGIGTMALVEHPVPTSHGVPLRIALQASRRTSAAKQRDTTLTCGASPKGGRTRRGGGGGGGGGGSSSNVSAEQPQDDNHCAVQ